MFFKKFSGVDLCFYETSLHSTVFVPVILLNGKPFGLPSQVDNLGGWDLKKMGPTEARNSITTDFSVLLTQTLPLSPCWHFSSPTASLTDLENSLFLRRKAHLWHSFPDIPSNILRFPGSEEHGLVRCQRLSKEAAARGTPLYHPFQ